MWYKSFYCVVDMLDSMTSEDYNTAVDVLITYNKYDEVITLCNKILLKGWSNRLMVDKINEILDKKKAFEEESVIIV